jgi:hypothetical protein
MSIDAEFAPGGDEWAICGDRKESVAGGTTRPAWWW